jgi:hypothetical protein
MAAVPGPQPKLQLLADALAMEFSQSLASAQCAAALKRLLPGLEYLRCACRAHVPMPAADMSRTQLQ